MKALKFLTILFALTLGAAIDATAQEVITAAPVTGEPKKWTFTMPDGDVRVKATFEDEPYFILTDNDDVIDEITGTKGKTLTFYYDGNIPDNNAYEINVNPGFYDPKNAAWSKTDGDFTTVTKVVFDKSFANVKPTNCNSLFEDFTSLKTITDIKYLNTSEVTDMGNMFKNCSSLTSLDLSTFNTSKVGTDQDDEALMSAMFYGCSSLTSLDLSSFNTENVNNMRAMFYGCSGLTSLVLSSFNTANVTDMNNMFYGCSSLTTLNVSNFNTGNVENMNGMFHNCYALTSLDLSNFNTGSVTSMGAMFQMDYTTTTSKTTDENGNEIEQVIVTSPTPQLLSITFGSNFTTKNVWSMSEMFAGCSSLASISLNTFTSEILTHTDGMFFYCKGLTSIEFSESFTAASVQFMSEMFKDCSGLTSLDLSKFSPAAITDMSNMFDGCTNLKTIQFGTFTAGSDANMGSMFLNCSSLTTLDLKSFHTANVTNMSHMFEECSALTAILVNKDNWDVGNVTENNSFLMFSGCSKLIGERGTECPKPEHNNYLHPDKVTNDFAFDKDYACIDDPANEKKGYLSTAYTVIYDLAGGELSSTTGYTQVGETNVYYKTLADAKGTSLPIAPSSTSTATSISWLGNTFNGWKGSNGTTPTTAVTIPEAVGNYKYTADWKQNLYSVKLDDESTNVYLSPISTNTLYAYDDKIEVKLSNGVSSDEYTITAVKYSYTDESGSSQTKPVTPDATTGKYTFNVPLTAPDATTHDGYIGTVTVSATVKQKQTITADAVAALIEKAREYNGGSWAQSTTGSLIDGESNSSSLVAYTNTTNNETVYLQFSAKYMQTDGTSSAVNADEAKSIAVQLLNVFGKVTEEGREKFVTLPEYSFVSGTTYTLTNGKFSITGNGVAIIKKKLTPTIDGTITKVYDGNKNVTSNLSVTNLEGVVTDETVEVNTITGTYPDSKVGTYSTTATTPNPVTVAITLEGADADNYTVEDQKVNGTITALEQSYTLGLGANYAVSLPVTSLGQGTDAVKYADGKLTTAVTTAVQESPYVLEDADKNVKISVTVKDYTPSVFDDDWHKSISIPSANEGAAADFVDGDSKPDYNVSVSVGGTALTAGNDNNFVISTDGTLSVEYTITDKAGSNTYHSVSKTVKIDNAPPYSLCVAYIDAANHEQSKCGVGDVETETVPTLSITENTLITLCASDATSGVAKIFYTGETNEEGATPTYNSSLSRYEYTYTPTVGVHTLKLNAKDFAGNSQEKPMYLTLTVTHPVTITFDGNDGSLGSEYTSAPTVAIDYDGTDATKSYTIPAASANYYTRTGYTLTSWNTVKTPTAENPGTSYKADGTGKIAIVGTTTDIKLYAQWTINQYAINLPSNMEFVTANNNDGMFDYQSTVEFKFKDGAATGKVANVIVAFPEIDLAVTNGTYTIKVPAVGDDITIENLLVSEIGSMKYGETPSYAVSYNGIALSPEDDETDGYTAVWSVADRNVADITKVDAGTTAKLTVSYTNEEITSKAATVSQDVTIDKATFDIIEVANMDYTCGSGAWTPTDDFKVYASNNSTTPFTAGTWTLMNEAGTAEVTSVTEGTYKAKFTPTDQTNYAEAISANTFKITFKNKPLPEGIALAEPNATITFNGNEQKPAIAGLTGLTEGEDKDYVITYEDNVNAGTASYTVTGKGCYVGSEMSDEFTISPLSITDNADLDFTVNVPAAGLTYNGTAQKPDVTVKYKGTELALTTDYAVGYANNINATTDDNLATATISSVQNGNYDFGRGITRTFSIGKAPLKIKPDAGQTKKYGEVDPTLTYTYEPATLYATNDKITGNLTREAGENFGEYEIKQGTLSAGSNYAITVTSGVKFKITKADAPTITDEQKPTANRLSYGTLDAPEGKNLVYNRTAQQLVVAPAGTLPTGYTIKYAIKVEGSTAAFATTIPTATNAGTYTVLYMYDGGGNYEDISGDAYQIAVTIDKADITNVTAPEAITNLVYNGNDQALVTAGSTSVGTMMYSVDGNDYQATIPTGNAAGEYTVKYMVKGNDNYKDYTPNVVIPVKIKGVYTIKFFDYDGTTLLGETSAVEGKIPVYPGTSNPTRSADKTYTYEFSGWNPELYEANGNQDYKAQYSTTTNCFSVKANKNEFVYNDADQKPTLVVYTKPGDEEFTLIGDGAAPEYKVVWPQDVKNFGSKTVTVSGLGAFATCDAQVYTWTITKAKYSEPDVVAEAETVKNKADGKITGVSSAMEYRKDGVANYTAIDGDATEISPLAPGKYYVRYKEDGNHLASDDKMVEVGASTKLLTVTFNSNGGSVVSSVSTEYGKTITAPTAPTKTGHDFDAWYTDGENFAANTKWDFATDLVKDNITLYANWKVQQHTVTFVFGNGDANLVIKKDFGTDISALKPSDPVWRGHKFTGWNKEIPITIPAEDVTITAQWEDETMQYVKFVTKWDDNSLTTYESFGAYPGESIEVTAPNDPERTGYLFQGWVTEDGQTATIPTVMPDNGMIIYADWKINQYTITFDTDGGNEIAAIKQNYNTAITKPDNPKREGYTFVGWDKAIPESMPAENMTITAKWTINQYTITFDTDGGSAIAAIKQDYNTSITAPANPTKTGYTFDGWDKTIPAKMPAEDITIKATWKINQYTLSFDTDGGTAIADIKQDYNTAITAPAAPSKTGYVFDYWMVDGVQTDIPTNMPAKDITFKAKWTTQKYTVTFNSNGGTAVADVKQEYNLTISAPEAPTKEGNTFKGWFTDDVTFASPWTFATDKVTSDITLYAKWTVNKYKLSFDTDGGTLVADIEQEFGSSITASTNTTKEGYTFDYWTVDGVQTAIPTTMPAKNITFKANWKINTYKIVFHLDNGDPDVVVEAEYGAPVTAPANFSKENHTFDCWSRTVPATMPASEEPLEITALWIEDGKYTVKLLTENDLNEEVVVWSSQSYYEDEAIDYTSYADPTRDGYTFQGWATADGQATTMPAKMPEGGATLYAKWGIKQYTITYNTNGGSAINETNTLKRDYNSAIPKPSDPSKTGNTFKGWFTDSDCTTPCDFANGKVTGDITLYAKWEVNTYTITFNTDGGTTVPAIEQLFGTSITKPNDPTKEGYTFAGWDKTIPTTMPEGGMTITAQWTINQYTITFYINEDDKEAGRNAVGTIKQNYNTPVDASNIRPTKEGYTFKEWKTPVPSNMPAENISIVADWTINQYTITFNSNGGSPVDPITQDYNSAIVAPANPSREGFEFMGWNPELPATMPAGGLDVTAVWQEAEPPVVNSITINGIQVYPRDPEKPEVVVECIGSGEVKIEATDNSNVQPKVEYTVNGGESKVYEGPFTLDTHGEVAIKIVATDNVGNEADPIVVKAVVRREAALAAGSYTYTQLSGKDVVLEGFDLDGADIYSIVIDEKDEYKDLFVAETNSLDDQILNNVAVGKHTLHFYTSLNGNKHDTGIKGVELTVFGYPVMAEQLNINANGYCEDENADITLEFKNIDRPVWYKIKDVHTSYQEFKGVDKLAKDVGIMNFLVNGLPDGNLTLKATFTDDPDKNTESDTVTFNIKVNLPSGTIVQLFDDLIAIDNHDDLYTAFQWYKDGVLIEGADQQYYQVEGKLYGKYSAFVTISNGDKLKVCSADFGKDLSKSFKRSVNAYPNPARAGEEITLELLNFDDAEYEGCVIKIVNAQGAAVATIDNCSRINTVSLPSGTYTGYVIRSGSNGERVSFKLIVK